MTHNTTRTALSSFLFAALVSTVACSSPTTTDEARVSKITAPSDSGTAKKVLAPAQVSEAAPVQPSAVQPASQQSAAAQPAVAPTASADKKKLDKPATLRRLVIASDVKEREPIPLVDGTAKMPLVAFLEVGNPGSTELDVLVTFEHESGAQVGFVELTIPGEMPRFRTWARTQNVKQPGTWTAIVTTDAGDELGRQSFTLAPATPAEAPTTAQLAPAPASEQRTAAVSARQ